jgi:hypothetical protein
MEEKKYTIPGTGIKVGGVLGAVLTGAEDFIGNTLTPLLGFGSGLLLSQITHIADSLTKETIQNWVKRNFIDPPRNGRFYDENQVARTLFSTRCAASSSSTRSNSCCNTHRTAQAAGSGRKNCTGCSTIR